MNPMNWKNLKKKGSSLFKTYILEKDENETIRDYSKNLIRSAFGGISFVILVIGGGMIAPLLLESTDSSCHALEKRFIKLAKQKSENIYTNILLDIGMNISNLGTKGSLAREYAVKELGGISPVLACPLMYFYSYTNNDLMIFKDYGSNNYDFKRKQN